MLSVSGPYRIPAALMTVAAVLHFAAAVIPSGPAIAGSVLGIAVHVVAGIGLLRGWRWFTYVGFLVALIGGIVSLAIAAQGASLGSTIQWGIVIVDGLAAVWLLAQLWRSAEPATD
ncbi:MAG: hypothetical protein RID42_10715 [Alphaproteobacteria bacterium]